MINWNDGLLIGVKVVDDDHKNLLDIINKLSEAVNEDTNKKEFEILFDKLEMYAKEHFSREEVLLKKCAYKDFDNHQYQHQFFANKIIELKKSFFSKDDYFNQKEVITFLTDWLMNHIVNEDLKFINCLQKVGLIEEDESTELSWKEKLLEFITTTISFNKRMHISVIIPLIGMFLFALLFVWNSYKDYTSVKNISRVTRSILDINNLTHSLQIERGLTSGYISSKNNKFYKKLIKQRKISDDAIEVLISKLELEKKYFSNNAFDKFIRDAEVLKNIRFLIDSKKISKEDEFSFYTKMIRNILTMTSSIMFLDSNKDISYSLSLLSSMINLKEVMGQERAYGMMIIEQGNFTDNQYKEFFKLQASEETYFSIFNNVVTKKHMKMMNKFLSSNIYKRILLYKEEILSNNYTGLDSKIWFELTTKNINDLNKYINLQLTETNNMIKKNIDKLFYNFILWVIYTLIILIVTRLIIYLFEKSNNIQLLKLSNGMKEIAAGNRAVKLLNYHDFKDNISEMYGSYELTRRALLKSDIYAQMYMEQEKTKVLYQEKINKRLEKEVNQDGLTGLYNRRYFDMIFLKELSRARRDKLSFTFIMMDIDHFKQYNDTYGHSEGDNVLKSIAQFLDEQLSRAGDFCFRLGGEEFGFFFTSNTLEEVLNYTKVICKGIENLHIEHSKNSASNYVTASFGLIHFNAESVVLDEQAIYIAADNALYRAKESGRNRVVAHDMNEM